MVICYVPLHLLERAEALKHVVLEDRVELVLERSQERCRIQRVDTLVVPLFAPVQVAEVPLSELVQHEVHSSNNLALVKAGAVSSELLLGQEVVGGIVGVPDLRSFEPCLGEMADLLTSCWCGRAVGQSSIPWPSFSAF